ncbi:MAG: Sapep family Mn(2+)-dependent dipeptidase [Clostridia bacterium]|nr:Sapep family Mn(2+)-dependent dipeptidase [Clostridia bacterium]
MNDELIAKIDKLIEEDRAELAKDVIKLVNIKSVRSEPLPGAPFGEGPRKVLDTVLEMGRERGFETTDYGVGVVSLAFKKGQPDVGVWAHGDVVPEGDGWIYEPYNAFEYKGCIIGRGATDNKGQLTCILHLMSIFKKLGIELKYNAALYVGSNEETGMEDIVGNGTPDAKGFINVCTPPRLSLVPDGGFPVGYAGKGRMKIELKAKKPVKGFTMWGGRDDAPGRATAVFDKTGIKSVANCTVEEKDGKTVIFTETPPRHSAHPDPNGNMITVLTKALIDEGLVTGEDAKELDFIRRISCDTKGVIFGIDRVSEIMGETVVASVELETQDGCPVLTLNIRYPEKITYEEMYDKINAVCAENGFETQKPYRGVNPYVLDKEWDVLKRLNAIANEVTGSDSAPFSMGGGTYAHRLPNALVYGMSGCLKPEGFPEGHGGAHGRDEVVSLDRLQRAMRIYARAFLALNEMEW